DPAEVDLDTIDLCDLARFEHGFPHDTFAALRERRPVWYHPPGPHVPGDDGFWVLSRHADVLAAASAPVTFSSVGAPGREGGGTLILHRPVGCTGVLLDMTGDPRRPRVGALRTPALSPRAIRSLEADIRRRSDGIVAAALRRSEEAGEVDLLVHVVAELPLQA